VIDDLEAVALGHALLQPLDLLIHEFDDVTGFKVDHMIVVLAFVQFIACLGRTARAVIEHVLSNQSRGLELIEYPINGGQTNVLALLDQQPVDIVGGNVLLAGAVQQLENSQARQGNFQACPPQLTGFFRHATDSEGTHAYCIIPRTLDRFHIAMSRSSLIYCLLLALLLGGCTVVHKQHIQQGNVIDQDDLDQLEAGMTKRQVMVLLGSPAIQSPFHSDRWDYINTFARRGGDAERRTLTVEFENGAVSDFHGSYLDGESITGENVRDVEIIDPNTNRPVLPPRGSVGEDDSPIPSADRPSGG